MMTDEVIVKNMIVDFQGEMLSLTESESNITRTSMVLTFHKIFIISYSASGKFVSYPSTSHMYIVLGNTSLHTQDSTDMTGRTGDKRRHVTRFNESLPISTSHLLIE